MCSQLPQTEVLGQASTLSSNCIRFVKELADAHRRERKTLVGLEPRSPPGGLLYPVTFTRLVVSPHLIKVVTALKGLRDTPNLPSTRQACWARRLALACSLTALGSRLPSPLPPTPRPSAGRESACLSRPIYHPHTNNTRESAETPLRSPWPARFTAEGVQRA